MYYHIEVDTIILENVNDLKLKGFSLLLLIETLRLRCRLWYLEKSTCDYTFAEVFIRTYIAQRLVPTSTNGT